MINAINILLCLVILLRTLCFYKPHGATHRPLVAFVAYLIIAVAGTELIQLLWFGRDTDLGELIYKCILALVLLKSRGNVVDLFYTREDSTLVFRLLTDTWTDIRNKISRILHLFNGHKKERGNHVKT